MKHVAILTGASGGLGSALTAQLLAHGWKVVAATRHPESCVQDADVRVVDADITTEEGRMKILDEARSFGPIHALINNAATAGAGDLRSLTAEKFRETFDVNVVSAHALSRMCHEELAERNGVIVHVSSVVGFFPLAYMAAYSASKHALNALAQTQAMEWAGNPRIVLVEPGFLTSKLCVDALAESAAEHTAMKENIRRASRKRAIPVERAARIIVRAMNRRRPFARVRIGFHAKALFALSRFIPVILLERIALGRFRSPKHASAPDDRGTGETA